MIGAISFTKLGVSIVLHYIISGCSFDALIAVAMDYFSMQVRLLTGFISNHWCRPGPAIESTSATTCQAALGLFWETKRTRQTITQLAHVTK